MKKDIKYKKIPIEDRKQVKTILNVVIDNLENKDFFMTITKEELDDFFDQDKCILYGAYDGNKLIGMARLYFEEKNFIELKKIVELEKYKTAKLGRYVVLQEYRNRGIMFNLQELLIREAKKIKWEYVIVMAHPQNIASNMVIIKSDMKLKKTVFLNNGYNRNIYIKKV